MKSKPIDLVVMWVDNNDPQWQQEKARYSVSDNADGTIYRYRDWDLMRYWFRGVEQFAPWINNLYFVTWGHTPEWLNPNHPKLHIVKHEDFIPKEFLPTFSANTIETNLHRIRGLSEKFVLMNDDVFFIDKTSPCDFFHNDTPKDTVALNVHCPQKSLISQYFCLNDTGIINEHFDFRQSIKSNIGKWLNPKNGFNVLRTLSLLPCPRFPGFWQHHLASAYLKSTLETVWEKEPEVLSLTCSHKFRETTDVNQWVFKEWQIASGNFSLRSHHFGKAFYIDRDGVQQTAPRMLKYILQQKGKLISINDGPMTDNEFSSLVQSLQQTFNKILPKKSSYEK